MNLLGVRNANAQTLITGARVNLGSVYRKFCRKENCVTTFAFSGDSITLNHKGIYHITLTAIVSAPAAGDVTLQLLENGVAIPGAIATETIATATTEFHTLTIDHYSLVDSTCLLGNLSTLSKNITISNTGVGATITNIVVNVTKEV